MLHNLNPRRFLLSLSMTHTWKTLVFWLFSHTGHFIFFYLISYLVEDFASLRLQSFYLFKRGRFLLEVNWPSWRLRHAMVEIPKTYFALVFWSSLVLWHFRSEHLKKMEISLLMILHNRSRMVFRKDSRPHLLLCWNLFALIAGSFYFLLLVRFVKICFKFPGCRCILILGLLFWFSGDSFRTQFLMPIFSFPGQIHYKLSQYWLFDIITLKPVLSNSPLQTNYQKNHQNL